MIWKGKKLPTHFQYGKALLSDHLKVTLTSGDYVSDDKPDLEEQLKKAHFAINIYH